MRINNCPYCNNKNLYILKNEYRKCASCGKKFSPKKLEMDLKIIGAFCDDRPALEVSKEFEVNYRTVSNRYDTFRKLIANYLEDLYHLSIQDNTNYEEFYYFTDKQLIRKHKSLCEAINIIGFYSNNRVYTLLMPSLPKPMFTQEKDVEFERYLKWHKVQSRDSYMTPLKQFWNFLSEHLRKYKGINQDNFFYYLKECEFKYNFNNKAIAKALLKDIYFK